MFLRLCAIMVIGVVLGCAGGPPAAVQPKGVSSAEGEIDRLVALMGDDDYHVREKAQKDVEALPTSALDAVKAAVGRSADAETKHRGERAINALEDRVWLEQIEKQSLTNSIGMKMRMIPAGEFMMGSPETEKKRQESEGPRHQVKITKAFYMGATEVTQGQFKAVMGNNPSQFKGDDLPVEQVSWNDCHEFLKKLSAKEGKTYRLPTEAEWEYACRAGTTTPFNTGETISTDQANYDGYEVYGNGVQGKDRRKTTPVGIFKPNAWGLYDMHGNVWEWCEDWYDENYYRNSPAADPTGPAQGVETMNWRGGKGPYRVLRGGAWIGDPGGCRSADRRRDSPNESDRIIGFRVVMSGAPMTP